MGNRGGDVVDGHERNMFNVSLARLLGLYQILDPATVEHRGRNPYHVLVAVLSAFGYWASAMLCANAAYYTARNGTDSVLCSTIALNYVHVCWKMSVVVRRSGDLWRCLRVTWFDFLSAGRRGHGALLRRRRDRSALITNAFFLMMCWAFIIYVSCPLALGNTYVTMTSRDGSTDDYRLSVFNVYFLMPADGYNRWYYALYLTETLALAVFCLFNLIFDTLLITLCLAISSQFQTVSAETEYIGHDRTTDRRVADHSVEKVTFSRQHDMVYDELKTIIIDHQAIIKKHKEFLSVFRWAILTQIFVSSTSLILLWFIVVASIIESGIADMKPTTIRLLTMLPPYIFQIFMTCYLFESMNNQKESIIFSLYSSNWTDMNLKCKNLILLTMKINNAHQRKLQFTKTRDVNLEMFYKTTHFCFSILSVLLNYSVAKKQL